MGESLVLRNALGRASSNKTGVIAGVAGVAAELVGVDRGAVCVGSGRRGIAIGTTLLVGRANTETGQVEVVDVARGGRFRNATGTGTGTGGGIAPGKKRGDFVVIVEEAARAVAAAGRRWNGATDGR